MRDTWVWFWNRVWEWCWLFPLMLVWGMMMCLARIQAILLRGTMYCCDWFAACLDEDEVEQEDGDDTIA